MDREHDGQDFSNWDVPVQPKQPDGATIYELIVPPHLRRPTSLPIIPWNTDHDELWASDPTFDHHEPNAPLPQEEPDTRTYFD